MAGDLRLVTPDAGLSTADARARLDRDGPNTLPSRPGVPVWRRVLSQLRDPLIVVLLVAVALTVVTGDWTDAAVIVLVIVVNTTVGVAQEVKADRAITALAAMTAPEARVLRDGEQRPVPAAEVVVGDVLILAEGDIVPADATVVEAAALLVDESALTGESVPVEKAAASRPDAAGRPDATGDLERAGVSAGTVVVRGRGRAVVTATGTDSAMGRIASLMATGSGLTPLQRRLIGVGRALAVIAILLCTVVLVLGLVRGEPLELMVVTAISLVVAAVPESLPAVVTLALALGARRMAARHALIRRLPAVETLGSVTVIATDKTGTLTEGRMVARRLWTATGTAEIEGHGYEPVGAVHRAGVRVTAATAPDLNDLLTAAALCTDAALRAPTEPTGDWTALGDPTEAALLAAAGRLGLDPAGLKAALPRIGEIPFDSDRKRMTTVHRTTDSGARIVCKGAPEVLLHGAFLEEPPELLDRAVTQAHALAEGGYRVLAVAHADRDIVPPVEAWETGLRLLGLVAIRDPARPSARATIAACQAAGISPVLITGDHPATARAVAAEVGIIPTGGEVVDCRRLAAIRPEDLRDATVFARATPEQKLDIVTARRTAGDVVAMTGDGVNDAPALKKADVGIAMGITGTDVSKEAAAVTLLDDNFATIVAAVDEGRVVFSNIRKYLSFLLSSNIGEILLMAGASLAGLPLPLTAVQILYVNLATDGLPALALAVDPREPDLMKRKPRDPRAGVFTRPLVMLLAAGGVWSAAVNLGLFTWLLKSGRPLNEAMTMTFVSLVLIQFFKAFNFRSDRFSVLRRPFANHWLNLAVGWELALLALILYTPFLQGPFGTFSFAWTDWAITAGLAFTVVPVLEAVKWLERRGYAGELT